MSVEINVINCTLLICGHFMAVILFAMLQSLLLQKHSADKGMNLHFGEEKWKLRTLFYFE